jgi:hypothetical protein
MIDDNMNRHGMTHFISSSLCVGGCENNETSDHLFFDVIVLERCEVRF